MREVAATGMGMGEGKEGGGQSDDITNITLRIPRGQSGTR